MKLFTNIIARIKVSVFCTFSKRASIICRLAEYRGIDPNGVLQIVSGNANLFQKASV